MKSAPTPHWPYHTHIYRRALPAMSLDAAYVLKACTALVAHARKSSSGVDLFEDATSLTLEIRLQQMPGRAKTKQLRMCAPLARESARAPCARAPRTRSRLPLRPPPPVDTGRNSLPARALAARSRTRASTPSRVSSCASS
jgi:hypothetical protein